MESEDAFFVGPRPKREVEMPRAGGLNSHSRQTWSKLIQRFASSLCGKIVTTSAGRKYNIEQTSTPTAGGKYDDDKFNPTS